MASQIKPPSQQKLLQILQNCKQIPKDDRLALRKKIKEGDEQLTSILADYNNKKLQIRLRKFLCKTKQNKKGDGDINNNRQKTNVDVRALTKEPIQSYYRSALQSLEKDKRKTIEPSKIKEFKDQLEEYRYTRSGSHSELLKPFTPITNTLKQSKEENLVDRAVWNSNAIGSGNKYTLQNNYLRQGFTSPYSSSSCELFKWDGLKIATSVPASNFSSMRNSLLLHSIPGCISPTPQDNEFSSIFSKMRTSLVPEKQQPNPEKDLYNFKSALIRHFAQDIFQHLSSKHFPLSLNDKSVYLPYRQFLHELQQYLQGKGENVQIFRENDAKVPLMEPFTNQYEAVNVGSLGMFLEKFCLHKNNSIRNIFIVMESGQGSGISLEKFRKINSWKGQEIIELFDKLVRKWGQSNTLSYWQAIRVKNEKQFTNFITLYSKL